MGAEEAQTGTRGTRLYASHQEPARRRAEGPHSSVARDRRVRGLLAACHLTRTTRANASRCHTNTQNLSHSIQSYLQTSTSESPESLRYQVGQAPRPVRLQESEMSTLRQIEANRRNARKSTGPASVTGQAVSSMNALKTGIHAKSLILPTEKLADLEELIEEYCRHHQPVSPEARLLVDDLITAGSRHGAVPRKRVCDLELIALPALHFGVGHRTRLHSKEPFRPLRSADLHRPPTGLNRGSPSCCCGIAAVQYRYAPLVPAPALSTGCGKTARPSARPRSANTFPELRTIFPLRYALDFAISLLVVLSSQSQTL